MAAAPAGSLAFASNPPAIEVNCVDVSGGTALGQAKVDVLYDGVVAMAGVTTSATLDLTGAGAGVRLVCGTGTYATNQSWRNRVTSWTSDEGNARVFSQASASLCPSYIKTGSVWRLDFTAANSERLICTTAAVANLFTNAAAFNLWTRVASDDPAQARFFFSAGNAAHASNGSKRFGTNTTGSGRWVYAMTDDSAGAGGGPFNSSANINTNDHLLCFRHTGSQIILTDDGAEVINAANAPGTVSPTQCAIGARMQSTPSAHWDGKIGSIRIDGLDLASDVRSAIAAGFPA
jgi:hypothetical protein